MNLSHAIDEFLLAKNADNVSDSTMKWYKSNLGIFLAYAQNAIGDADVTTITTRQLRGYIVYMKSRTTRYELGDQKPVQEGGLSDDTIETRKRILHTFFKWCSEEFHCENPMRRIARKQPKRKPKSMNPKDFVKLFNATLDTESGIRDRALLAFIADTGCRRGGAITLTLTDLSIEERQAYVTEKGDQLRTVHFTDVTADFLTTWLDVRESAYDHVFVNMNTGEPLKESGVNQMLKRLKQRSGVTGRVNPHSMRHQFAREYIKNGGDIATLAQLLGHKNIDVTAQYYAVFTDDELGSIHNRNSPLNGLNLI